MSKKALMIVESPTKVKTLKKFIDKDIEVTSSYGHIRDLPPKQFGIKIEEGKFIPQYKVLPSAQKRVASLKQKSANCDTIYLATDPDREGEAISFHLQELLKTVQNIKRIEFNELTKSAVTEAFKNSRNIDMNRVNAQQARRILDRIVGYKVSPVLWKAISKGLSAGRVQSAALKLICDIEEKINNFQQEEFWTIEAELLDPEKNLIKAKLNKFKNKKIKISDKKESKKIETDLKNGKFIINDIEKKIQHRYPQAPLITSKLQQIAYNKLGFTTKKTMMIAQQLYEGVNVGNNEVLGLITYMRTDSTRISKEAFASGIDYIKKTYGEEYVGYYPKGKSKKNIQDAHEAIRPTYISIEPDSIKNRLSSDQFKLYKIIWQQFLKSIMKPAKFDVTKLIILNNEFEFTASGQILLFDGFLKLEPKTDEDNNNFSKSLKKEQELLLEKLLPKQNFTQPPSRFTEATLVKKLEEKGIGRPSTYASIVSTIQERGYVEKEKRFFIPTLLGVEVNKLLQKHFPEIVNLKFTANMEEDLDKIENSNADWQKLLNDFYTKFVVELEKAKEEVKELKNSDENNTGIKCEKCGSEMIRKINKKGEFIACSNFPKCKNTKSITRDKNGELIIHEVEYSDKTCPKCNGRLIKKASKISKFLACENYPKCKYTESIGIGLKCPVDDCDGEIIVVVSKRKKKFYGCTNYPDCGFMSWYPPVDNRCPECGSSYLLEINNKRGKKIKCPNKDCGYSVDL